MKFKFIGKLIDEDYISEAQGRLIEYTLICGLTYLLGAIIAQDPLSLQAFIVAVWTPILWAASKARRDYEKEM